MTSEKRTDGGTVTGSVRESEPGLLARLWLKVANRYERYRYLEAADREEIDVHGYGTIISHWALLVFMITTTLTGLSKWLGVYGPLDIGIWGGYNPAFLTHVWTGMFLAVFAFILYPFYALVVDGKQILLTWEQIEEQIVITLALVGLASYIPGYKKARRSIDADSGHWVGHHPMQTVFWYVTWGFVGIITLTGFGLWAILSIDPAWWVSGLGFLQAWIGFEALLRLHLVATAWVLAAVGIHAYFALMPSNWDLLRLMIDGRVNGWLLGDDDHPPRRGLGRTKDALVGTLSGLSGRLGTGPGLQERLTQTDDSDEEAAE